MGAEANQIVLLIIGIILVLAGIVSLLWLVVSRVKNKASKQINRVFLFVGLALVLSGAYLTVEFFNNDKPTPFEINLTEQAEELNKSLPKMLDDNTRFEDVTVFGTEIYYRHTVVNQSIDQLDQEAFQKIMHMKLINNQCQNNDIIALLQRGVKYRYNYFGNKGALISTVVISKGACGVR